MLSSIILLSTCTSMVLQYDTSVTLKNGKELYFTKVKPVDITGTSLGCTLTALYYGGWCWSYFAHPYFADQQKFILEAQKDLNELMKGRWYMIGDERVSRVGWQERKFETSLFDEEGEPVSFKKTKLTKRQKKSKIIEEKIEEKITQRIHTLENPDNVMFAYADAGSFFSPHGTGLGIGYKWDKVSFDIGLGVDVRKISNPISLQFTTELQSFFAATALSFYAGSGEQNVLASDGNVYAADVTWQMVYAQMSIGTYIIHNAKSNFQLAVDAGAGIAVYDKYKLQTALDPMPDDVDIKGIETGSNTITNRRFARKGIGGVFGRITLIYWLNFDQ